MTSDTNDIDYKKQTLFAQMHITDACNLRCKHCYVGEKLNRTRISPSIDVVKTWIDNISCFSKQIGFNSTTIALTGGEPLLRNDIVELVAYMKTNGILPFVLSNGLLFNEKLAKQLRDGGLQHVQFSLEGLKKENDFIRGEGTFDAVLQSIKIACNNNFLITIGITITRYNIVHLVEFVKFLEPLVSTIHIREIFSLGNGISLGQLSDGQRYRLYKFIRDYKGKLKLVCEDPCICSINNGPVRQFGCAAMKHSFCIDVDGSVYPCRLVEISLGNIKNLESAWFSELAKKFRYRIDYKGACGNCYLLEHCGGCRAYTYMKGDLFGEDDRCFVLKPFIKPLLKKWIAKIAALK